MAVASGANARDLFCESKRRLSDRIQLNINNFGSVAKQIVRGSKSNEMLQHSFRNFALQEYAVVNSEVNLKKMALLTTSLKMQVDSIQKSAEIMDNVKTQLDQFGK
ncbi:Uncharacterised protein g4073 [Pycnogonum litorale]